MKTLSLFTAAALAALMAIPAIASAGEWDIDSENEKLPLPFTIAGGAASFRDGSGSTTCTASTGTGSYETKTTGTVTLTLTGCKDPFGGSCQSGATAGTITTFALPFHNIMAEATGVSNFPLGTPGLLFTPNPSTGDFATFTCAVIGNVTLTGNGIIGDISNPACGGAFQKTMTLRFEEEAGGTGKQRWRQITTTGTEYDLKTDDPFVSNQTTVFIASMVLTFGQGIKLTCP